MPFTLDDLIERMGAAPSRGLQNEFVGGETASLKVMNREEVQKLFPKEVLSTDGSVAYVPVRMCNSYPKINKRGRFFLPEVLQRSCDTARDSLVNYDHYLKHNGEGQDICFGHIKSAVFDPEGLLAREVAGLRDLKNLPTISAPMMALTALYLRHAMVPGILKEHMSGKSWMTSMECEHQWKDAMFLYEGELVPIADAPAGMRECVENKRVKPFRDKALALGLGGRDGKLGFWGLGYTKEPADDDSDILAILAASAEVANKRTFLPLRCEIFSFDGKDREVANAAVDTRLSELSNIAVLGKTSAHEDGHTHDILTDGTMLPSQGHLHSVANWTIVKGTVPRFTGRTDIHHKYPDPVAGEAGGPPVMAGQATIHMHTFDIPLRGKPSSAEAANFTEEDLEELGVDPMKLSSIQSTLDLLIKKVSTGNPPGATPDAAAAANAGIASELASLRDSMSKLTLDETIQEAVGKEIANQLQAGTIVKKDDAAKATQEAVDAEKKKLQDEFDARQKQADIKAKRLEALNALGIDLQSKPYTDEDKDLTVQAKVDAIPLDATGDLLFKSELQFLKAAIALDVQKEEAAKTEVERKAEADRLKAEADEAAKLSGAGTAAANTGKKRRLIGAPNPTQPAATPPKPGAGSEQASNNRIGKHVFSN